MTEKEQQIRVEIIPQLQGLANCLWDKEVPDAVSGRKLDRLIDKLFEILNEKDEEIVYLLYDGESEDGRGYGFFLKMTRSKEEALNHLKDCRKSSYNVGHVKRVSDQGMISFHRVSEFTLRG